MKEKVYIVKTQEGDKREFVLSRFTPIVRRRLIAFIHEILDNMPEKTVKAFKAKSLDNANVIEMILGAIQYIEDEGCLEYLVAIIIRPKDQSEKDKDISGIASFLEENILLTQEVEIITDFFTSDTLVELALLKDSIKQRIQKLDSALLGNG